MNPEEAYEYMKHLRARSTEQLLVLKTWFSSKKSERDRNQKIKLIDAEIVKRNKRKKSYDR